MDRVSVLCALLLLCSLSGAELQDSEVIEQRKVSAESVNVCEQPQPCPSDVQAALREISAKLAENRLMIQQLQTLNQVEKVAFSASLRSTGSGFIGPYNVGTPLVFRHVFSNIGNAYNPNTGFFIAPVRGAYHFEYYIGSLDQNYYKSAASLVKNGVQVVIAYERGPNGHSNAANGVTLLLEPGDVVFVRLDQDATIYDDNAHFTSFSGHLLFPM